MDENKGLYAVLLKRQVDLKIPEIATVVAKFRGVPFQDVIGKVKSSWGIIQDDLQEKTAKELAAHLEEAGLGAVGVPVGLLEELPAPKGARQVRLDTDALGLSSEPDRWDRGPWPKIALIAAAGFKQTVSKTTGVPEGPGFGQQMLKLGIMMATGLPVRMGPKKQAAPKTIETTDIVFYLDLILDGGEKRFRIDAQNFDYSCLGARMEYNALANFRMLAVEIARRSPSAVCNRGTRILNEGRPIREMGYESLADLDRESRWLMTLRALKIS